MKNVGVFVIATCLATGAAFAQTAAPPVIKPPPYAGEIVVDRAGQARAPWGFVEACYPDAEMNPVCGQAVVNEHTREIAMFGDRVSYRFEKTGDGREVRRAEPTMDKARRLAGLMPLTTSQSQPR